jgi:hypothetical protein
VTEGSDDLLPDQPRAIQLTKKKITQDETRITQEILWPGDAIAYQVTHEVNYSNDEKMWVKYGATTSVRDGETTDEANKRLVEHVHNSVADAIREAVEAAGNIV